jgi:nitroimidazol reductase NimA-like FMN-containing flavoprotein (pyridoxamine 5'-phosphate oxidase superfamily)
MIKVEDMPAEEMRALLQSLSFGHLGCARENRPYVVPMHYAYEDGQIYFITTEGLKTDYIEQNPEVCFQVEDVRDAAHWRSVMVTGRAERLTGADELEQAMQLITRRNPSLTPAVSLNQHDAWGRANNVAVYRLRAEVMDGRQTSDE